MANNPNQPQEYDAVLGGATPPPVNDAVLGGLEGVKRRLTSNFPEVRLAALSELVKYGQAGLDLAAPALQNEPYQVQQAIISSWQKAEIKCKSEFIQLQNLLVAEKWEEADKKTSTLMLNICSKQQIGYLTVTDIKEFPCEYLSRIDQLWKAHSHGNFGLSVQRRIWKRIGGSSNPDWHDWCRFGKSVGWYVKDSWLWWNDVTFSLNAPAGHLPRGGALIGWGLGDFQTGCPMLSAISSRLENCNII
ncbi:MAG TPA: GUN4 domain-containing protein [Oculatellaceae cyanobacterium]|jgi:hypothetical protein